MKHFPANTLVILAMLFCGMACQRTKDHISDNDKGPTSFATPEEAANKARSDLVAVLRSGQTFDLGVDQATIEKSQPAAPIKHYQITFDNLLATGAADVFANLAQNEMAAVVPFVADNQVVTVAGVAKDGKGWKVASLADKSISNDLNMVPGITGDRSQGEITIYDLPNSAVKVYGVKKNNSEMFYTDYPGFSMQEGISAERILTVLKRDAAEFQRQYGDALKQQKLVR